MAEIRIITGPKSMAIITVTKESADYWRRRFDTTPDKEPNDQKRSK